MPNDLQTKLLNDNGITIPQDAPFSAVPPGSYAPPPAAAPAPLSAGAALQQQFAQSGLNVPMTPGAPAPGPIASPNLPPASSAATPPPAPIGVGGGGDDLSDMAPMTDAQAKAAGYPVHHRDWVPPSDPAAPVPFRQQVANMPSAPSPPPTAGQAPRRAVAGGGGAPSPSETQSELDRQIAAANARAQAGGNGRGAALAENAADVEAAANASLGERQAREAARSKEREALAAKKAAAEKEDAHATERDYFKSESGLQHVADLIGGIAGGALMGFRGLGSNPYMDQQNKRIDRFIAGQRAAHEDKVKGASNAYSAALDKYKDEDAAADAMKADVYGAAAARGEERLAKVTDADEAENLRQGVDALKMQRAQYKDRANAAAANAAAARSAAAEDREIKRLKLADELANSESGRAKAAADIGKTQEEIEASRAKREGGAGADGGIPAPKSTNWDPTRNIQGTAAFGDKLQQDQYNAQIMGTAHKQFGARTPEAQREIMAGYLINPGDSQETIDAKAAAYKKNFAGAVLRQRLAASPSADDLGIDTDLK